MKKIRVGIIGAGSWAISSHIPNFLSRPEVELVVVHRIEEDVVQKVKNKFGFQYATTNYKEVLQHQLDIVLVGSPTALHFEHTKAALQSGAHVLCEKPFTRYASEAWELDQLAKQKQLHLLLAYGWNYKRIITEAKRVMVEKGVGNVESIMVHMASPIRQLMQNTGGYHGNADQFATNPSTWTNPQLSGGGFAQAQTTHSLGIGLWLSELRAKEVFAHMYHAGPQIDLHHTFSIKFTNNAIGSVFGASNPLGANKFSMNKHQLEVRIFGNEGQLIVDLERELMWWFRSNEQQFALDLKENEAAYDCNGPVETIVDLALGKPVNNHSPAELGARVVEVLEAAYLSAASGRHESVNLL
jgi:predicted dehydrogenase